MGPWSIAASRSSARFAHDAAEAEMARRRVDALRHARGRAIAPTVVRRAEIRTALHDLARDFHAGCTRVVARLLGAAARVRHRAARVLDLRVLLVPIRCPLP